MNIEFTETQKAQDGEVLIVQVSVEGDHVGHLLRHGGQWWPCDKLFNACMGHSGGATLDEAKERARAMLEG